MSLQCKQNDWCNRYSHRLQFDKKQLKSVCNRTRETRNEMWYRCWQLRMQGEATCTCIGKQDGVSWWQWPRFSKHGKLFCVFNVLQITILMYPVYNLYNVLSHFKEWNMKYYCFTAESVSVLFTPVQFTKWK